MEQTQEQQQMQMLMTQLQDDNLRQSVMQYIKQTANGMDIGADSKVLIQTLARESVTNQKHAVVWKSRTKKSVVVGVLSVVLAIGVQFFVNYFTNELSKESHVDAQGAMVSTSGKVVKTQMDEMKVGSDGRLVSRDGKSNVKTMPTLARVGLSSSLPDKTLMGLDEIVVHSDKGYTLQIKVHGFSRIPVLNSRCGNVVHFYTAWKGKITLDSTDLSFDEATAAEFEKAGFALAMGGRRLGGGNKLEGFFKALDSANASGKWTCADVPLPTIPRTRIVKYTTHWPCTSGRCSSKYGSYLPGVRQAGRDFAKAIASSSAKILGNFALDMYMETQSTEFVSDRYQVKTQIMPQHPGQKLVSVFDAKTEHYRTFQSQSANKTRSHCTTTTKKKQTDTDDDMDVHFEYVGTNEESGVILRHFRMQRSSNFIRKVAGDDMPAVVTDFWDIAESMQPRRVLDGDGTVIMMEFERTSVSDGEIEKHFGKLLEECSDEDKETDYVPKMRLYTDLNYKEREYYWEQKFDHDEDRLQDAAAKGDGFASYLTRALDTLSISDDCQQKCTSEMNMALEEIKHGKLTDCSAQSNLRAALDCLASGTEKRCGESNFYENHEDCLSTAAKDNANATARMLETDEPEPEVSLLMNGTTVVPDSARALVDWSATAPPAYWDNNCISSLMIPLPHIWGTKIYPAGGDPFWTWPFCMEIAVQFDPMAMANLQDWMMGAVEEGMWGFKEWKKRKISTYAFTMRLTWTWIWTPGDGWDAWPGKSTMILMARACINIKHPWPVIQPPLDARMCAKGELGLQFGSPCPGGSAGKAFFSGRVFIEIDAFLNLWIMEISIAKFEIGIAAGYAKTWKGWCWWQRASEGWKRRRWWDRRRRNERVCDGGVELCDVYIRGWILVKFAIVQCEVDMIWWEKAKRLESTLTVSVLSIWEFLCADWYVAYQKMIWQKQWN